MGSKSSPQQTTSTSNTSVSYGLQDSTGVFGNGNQITYNTTDGGLVAGVTDIASQAFNAVNRVSGDLLGGVGRIIDGAEYTVGAMGDLAGDAVRENSMLARDAITSGNNLASDAILFGNDLAKELGLENAAIARDSLSFGGDLLKTYAQELSYARENSTDAIIKANQYALQFADNMSRSDGQQLALNSNKTLMYVLLGFAGLSALAIYSAAK